MFRACMLEQREIYFWYSYYVMCALPTWWLCIFPNNLYMKCFFDKVFRATRILFRSIFLAHIILYLRLICLLYAHHETRPTVFLFNLNF